MNIDFYTIKKIYASLLISGTILAVVFPPSRAQSEERNSYPQAYWDAVEDARIPAPDEIFNRLTAITPDNTKLTWDENGRVLVVTWTHHPYVQGDQPVQQDVWVTVVPDLQDFCKNYIPTPTTSLALRLNQLLGLPPDNPSSSARQVVEIWVDPQFIFRPSPDPEINDSIANISFDPLNGSMSFPPNYYRWFFLQYDQRYRTNAPQYPTPWTQLGYTYDWGSAVDWADLDPDRIDDVGLSEFVILSDSPVSVKALHTVESYCLAFP